MQLPGRAFADACHAGRFARCVLLRLLAKGAHSSSYGHFLVRNKDGGLTSFVDMGVYTRNRCADTCMEGAGTVRGDEKRRRQACARAHEGLPSTPAESHPYQPCSVTLLVGGAA